MQERGGARGLRRRELLAGTCLAFAASACKSARSAPAPEGDVWSGLRAQFPLDEELVHLNAMFITSHPRVVREAIERHRRGLDESPVRYLLENNTRLRLEVVEEAARYFGASEENVALTDSTTMGLGLLYNGLRLEEGDEVLREEPSYYSTVEALSYKAERTGASVRTVSIYDEPAAATAERMTEALVSAIGPRTRVLALTWVHSDTGLKLPVADICRRVAALNEEREPGARVLVCVDGVHGFGVEDVTLQELGCDFFAAGCHKWLFGPRGTGVLYAADASLWERMRPTIPAFGVQTTPGLVMTPGGFHSFELRWALAEAFRLHQQLGKAQVAARTRQLAGQLKEGLGELKRVQLLTPRDAALSAGIVAFNVEGLSSEQVSGALLERGFVVTPSTYGVPSVRVAPSVRNTPEELDRLVRAVAEL